MDESDQSLRQLRWIKWLHIVTTLCFMVIAASIAWMTSQMASHFPSADPVLSFSEQAPALLEQGKENEVLKLVQEREKSFPKDPYVYWYRGKAYYQLGQFEEALKAMRQVHELAPSWREEHAAPYIKAAEEKLAAKFKK